MNYKEWLAYMSQRVGRDVSQDKQDYDLQGYFNSLKANPGQGGAYDPTTKEAHLTSDFKLPNHPTFSTDSIHHVPVIQHGGEWTQQKDDKWNFKPSSLNLQNTGREELQSYFNGPAERNPEGLNLPSNELQSKARAAALKALGSK